MIRKFLQRLTRTAQKGTIENKYRALGIDPETQVAYEHAALMAVACGVTPEQMRALSRAAARGIWIADDLNAIGLPIYDHGSKKP